MSYRIPGDDEVREMILKVMQVNRIVESQAQLLREVLEHLRVRNPEYKLTGKRVRRIALTIPEIKVEIRCKETDEEVTEMKKCPVCGSKMERLENLTLEGRKITVGFRCTFCPYWTGKKLRVPTRYLFRIR